MKKVIRIFDRIFGWGIAAVLFAGGATALGFLAALVIGGDTAAGICEFLHKTIFRWIIATGSLLTLLGLVRIYLSGEHSLRLDRRSR